MSDSDDSARPAGDWVVLAALIAVVALVYQPAWHGGFLWDDPAHVTRPELRSWHGLWRIWFDLGTTQQYYPLLYSVFWVQHRLWGDATLGYHLVNILLHGTAAALVALVLRRLAVPGAYLAAAIFALHPVHVESVAWISEQKNTLSAVFFLGAALAYLHFDRTRRAIPYLAALGLFVLGLLSKTVTATLPAALLVLVWWQRGRLGWRRDVRPTVPLFALGACAGLLTAWVEVALAGAEGAAYALTALERFLLAGRALWFYAAKLLWPTGLLFVYPRWTVSQAAWWQYLFPAAALLLAAGLWRLRSVSRGPLAGALYFAGTLFPVLGFFNVYPFVFSFVADHFQYLASLGIITLVAAGAALLLGRWRLWGRPAGHALCLAPLAVLAVLTWRQCRMYADSETLYRATIAGNPAAWMAYNNLGNVLLGRGKTDEASALFEQALRIKPDLADAHNNLGLALARNRRLDEAIRHYQTALAIAPGLGEIHNNLGLALAGSGRLDEAVAEYRAALAIDDGVAQRHDNLGFALARLGRFDEAILHFERALEIQPDHPQARRNLAWARSGQSTR